MHFSVGVVLIGKKVEDLIADKSGEGKIRVRKWERCRDFVLALFRMAGGEEVIDFVS